MRMQLARRGAGTKAAVVPAAMSPAGLRPLVRPARAIEAVRAPGATTAFTARQVLLNAEVMAAQRTLAFVETATGQLRGLKGAISAMLSGAERDACDAVAHIETFDALWRDRAALTYRLDRALAATGVRASVAEDGQVDFTVAESRWSDGRDHLMVQGRGKRFPGGRPGCVLTDAVPEAVDPARWRLVERASQLEPLLKL
ncbi:hypothetical protein [Burkholderia sp. BE17]|uniref:hypothetical protein n=1 Tax=Burkholderia sp. BE17 TaxID=2656644 RepID=UPI00128C8A61|nr:hypothetical protein [Burkholderia sp. BE17]MPV69147.1 hypothetical protein [Burkholderia sp. BE17]